MKRLVSLFLALAMLLAAMMVPAAAETAAVTVTDMFGREVAVAGAQRIVVITASDAEILYAIGCGDRVVGRGAYCDYPAQVLDVPAVQSGYETNIEEIIALEPDLVIMAAMAQDPAQVDQLTGAGIPVVMTNAQTVADTYTAITLLGEATGHTAEAEALIADMQGALETMQAQAAGLPQGRTVYIEESPLEWGLWAAGSGTFLDEMCAMVGLTNVFADMEGHNAVSEEQVLARVPDYIVTMSMDYGFGPDPKEEIMSRAGWENVPAVQNGAILFDNSSAIARPGPRIVDAVKMLLALAAGE